MSHVPNATLHLIKFKKYVFQINKKLHLIRKVFHFMWNNVFDEIPWLRFTISYHVADHYKETKLKTS